jgi:hypothetical protein
VVSLRKSTTIPVNEGDRRNPEGLARLATSTAKVLYCSTYRPPFDQGANAMTSLWVVTSMTSLQFADTGE